jgi:nicotinamidase-related amidase
MTTVEVPDIPRAASVALPASTAALIVIDMQHAFVHPEGALYGPNASGAVPVIARLLQRARDAGARVVFTQDWHGADDPEFALWGEHARAEHWGAQIVPELAPQAEEDVIRKLRYDAFYGMPLDHRLRLAGIRDVVIAGTVANICVLHTAGSAALRHYRVVLPEDAVAALTPFDHAATLRQVTFLYAGVVTTSDGVRFV